MDRDTKHASSRKTAAVLGVGIEKTSWRCPTESSDSNATAFEDAMRKLEEAALASSPDNAAYATALEKCPELIDKESNRARYLRFCKYDPYMAAKRLVGYWKLRYDIFGDRCYRPIIDFSGEGAFSPDMVRILDTGVAYLAPPNKDGSMVICFDYSNTAKNNKRLGVSAAAEWKVKLVFFFCQLAAIPEASLQNGVVFIQVIREQRHTPSPYLFSWARRIGQEGCPFEVRSVHHILAPRDLPDKKLNTFSRKTIPYISEMLKGLGRPSHREIDFLPAERTDNTSIQRAKIAAALMDRVGILEGSLPAAAGGPWTYRKMKNLLQCKKGLRAYSEVQHPPTESTETSKKTQTINTSIIESQRSNMKEILTSPQGVSVYSDFENLPSWKARNDANASKKGRDSSADQGTMTPLALLADVAASVLADDNKKSQCTVLSLTAPKEGKPKA